jgi:hypothetical protein
MASCAPSSSIDDGSKRVAPEEVDTVRYLFQVVGIATPAVAAEVIQRKPGGQGATMHLIAHPVSKKALAGSPVFAADAPVSRLVDHSRPAPAPVWQALYFGIEAV